MSSNNSTKPRKRTGPKTAHSRNGEPIKLTTAVPGGMAQWFAPGDLTPRRSREYELIAAEMASIVEKVIDARAISVDGGPEQAFDGFTGAPVGLSRHELRGFLELTDAATVAHLKGWTLDLPLPETTDDLLELPRALYEALTRHGSKLLAATAPGTQFTVDALPDDLAEVDEDLPTSA